MQDGKTMKIFNLPDLGEGLAEAEIREWYVKEGDVVKNEQPLVAVETAKALVDVPSPQAGKVEKLYGNPGDSIKTGAPLIGFSEEMQNKEITEDTGTVVGNLETATKTFKESDYQMHPKISSSVSIKVLPAVRAIAKEFNIDLANIKPTGPNNTITMTDIKPFIPASNLNEKTENHLEESLRGTRKTMATIMTLSHKEVVPVTLMDYAIITHWKKEEDITLRIIHAMIEACKKEPSLNAHFQGENLSRKIFQEVHLGLALDTPSGLYVPVIHDANKKDPSILRAEIQKFKEQGKNQNFSPDQLKGATITLSNFGMIAGRYANPIVVPPTVAILGIGKITQEILPIENTPSIQRILPLSLSFDHRAVTGGEAARFLGSLIEDLQKSY